MRRPFVEHRLEGDDVGQVLAAAIGIVGDDDVVGAPLLRGDVAGEDLGEEAAHRVEVARDARRLRHVPAVAVEDGGGVVEQLAHDGGAAGAPHRDVHLGGRRGQRVVDDLELDRRDVGAGGGHGWALSAIRWPLLSRRQAQPSGEQHGRIGLLDHGRAGDHGLAADPVAVPHRRSRASRRPSTPCGPRAACARPSAAADGLLCGFGRRPIGRHAQRDDLHR